jgi:hypothetical protein
MVADSDSDLRSGSDSTHSAMEEAKPMIRA